MAKKENENGLTVQSNGFITMPNNFMAMVSEELDGLDIGFDRIKIPSGGAVMFELPGEDDEPVNVKEFSGVILDHHIVNTYYATKYTGGSNPPTCGSFDGIMGVGDPGGECRKCPYNQFGSGEGGGKACKNRRRVYILREGEMFPLLLSLPTGSLRAFTKYVKVQLSKGRKTNAVVTKFGLKKVMNTGGIAYSQATFALDRVLEPEEHATIEKLSEQVKAYSKQVGFDADFGGADEINIDPDSGEIIEPLGGGKAHV